MAVRANERIFSGPVLRLQPDRRLVALTGEGSEAAMEEIVRRYRPALVRYARSIVGADRAEDVVQDSLAKAVPAIGAGVEELHLRPWLYRIVRNTGINALRDAGPTTSSWTRTTTASSSRRRRSNAASRCARWCVI
jgi:RNA polymerase sigma factor (sigma-70 family)